MGCLYNKSKIRQIDFGVQWVLKDKIHPKQFWKDAISVLLGEKSKSLTVRADFSRLGNTLFASLRFPKCLPIFLTSAPDIVVPITIIP
jgi:hypothetical protein